MAPRDAQRRHRPALGDARRAAGQQVDQRRAGQRQDSDAEHHVAGERVPREAEHVERDVLAEDRIAIPEGGRVPVLEPVHPAARPDDAGRGRRERRGDPDEAGHAPPLQHPRRAVCRRHAEDDVRLLEVAEGQAEVDVQDEERRDRDEGAEAEPRRDRREEDLLVTGLPEPEPVGVVPGRRGPDQAEHDEDQDDRELYPALSPHGVGLQEIPSLYRRTPGRAHPPAGVSCGARSPRRARPRRQE